MSRIEVVRAGPLTTVQDGGRPGWAHLGVPPSAAVDRRSLGRCAKLHPHASARSDRNRIPSARRIGEPARDVVAQTGWYGRERRRPIEADDFSGDPNGNDE